MDGKLVAAYVDSILDPGDLPKAVVNSFAFNPDDAQAGSGAGRAPRPAGGEGRAASS